MKFERVIYEIKWYAEIRVCKDSEGRALNIEPVYSKCFATKEDAEADLIAHPDVVVKGRACFFVCKKPYHVCKIRKAEEKL